MRTNTKEWIQYSTAVGMLACGAVMAFLSFFIHGDIVDGVLWYIGQSLIFAGGVFGISTYFKDKLGESEKRMREDIKNAIREVREESVP